tara:strand:+ start:74 stop:367 length:294 start_codon:yes stop_codon:yes gene_type:complete
VVFSEVPEDLVAVIVPKYTTAFWEFPDLEFFVSEVGASRPFVVSWNRVSPDCDPLVETYVRRSTLVFDTRVRRELGGQVKEDCGGSAYEVMSLEEET